MPNQATSYVGSLSGIAQTIDSYGLDSHAIFRSVGIDLDSTQPFDDRVPLDVIVDAIMRADSGGIDILFGLKFAETVHPTTYHSLSVMLVSSTSLRLFCERLQRYYVYINDAEQVFFDDDGKTSRLRLLPAPEVHEKHQDLLHISAWCATWLRYMRMVYKPNFRPDKVCFTFDVPAEYKPAFAEHFDCEIEYAAAYNAIELNSQELDVALPGGNAELARHSEQLVFDYLASLGHTEFVNTARMKLFKLLPKGFSSQQQLADELEMDPDELAVELKLAGKNFQQLLGESRRELSDEYIMRSDLSVNEIAYLLGFSDCSNFARSFRRWNGLSPTEYRERARVIAIADHE